MRDKIKLESTAGTGHFYTTDKNKRNMPEKMEIKKFDPVARKHVIYKETKIKEIIDDLILFLGKNDLRSTCKNHLRRWFFISPYTHFRQRSAQKVYDFPLQYAF